MNAAVGEGSEQVALESATPGELLRRERARRQLSIQQAAEELHLDTWMIEAIEADRFAALGPPVYAKGHLRKYAALLGLPAETVIERYAALTDTPVVPTPIPVSVNAPVRTRRISLRIPLFVVASLLASGVAWWVFQWLMQPGSPAAVSPVPLSPAPTSEVVSRPGDDEGSAAALSEPLAEPRSTSASPAAEDASAAARAAADAAASEPSVRVRLEFSDASWVEIYDAHGKRLMFDMGAPGRVRTLSGTPPLQVTLGAASAVSAQVNDQPIVIPRRAGKDAAKFVIDATGAVSAASAP
ncbi:MAG: helix-turn-helix domain-containing protein [Steroidobacter sp.]